MLVMLSLSLMPVSSDVRRSGKVGGEATVSMVTLRAGPKADSLPARSTAPAEKACTPSACAATVWLPNRYEPPKGAPLRAKRKYVAPSTVNVGVLTLVMLSVGDAPESLALTRSGASGGAGATVSMVTARAGLSPDCDPPAGAWRAVKLRTHSPSLDVPWVCTSVTEDVATLLPSATPSAYN